MAVNSSLLVVVRLSPHLASHKYIWYQAHQELGTRQRLHSTPVQCGQNFNHNYQLAYRGNGASLGVVLLTALVKSLFTRSDWVILVLSMDLIPILFWLELS